MIPWLTVKCGITTQVLIASPYAGGSREFAQTSLLVSERFIYCIAIRFKYPILFASCPLASLPLRITAAQTSLAVQHICH